MRLSLAALSIAVSILASACGGASVGGSCNTDGLACEDSSNALECRVGTWRALPCRGPGGCKVSNSKVTCDMSLNHEGDACAASTEGQGICDPSGTAALTCRSGTLVKTNTCSSCTTTGDQIICQP